MRHIGNLDTESLARRFADFLLVKEIPSQIDLEDDAWAVWIINEDDVARARDELKAFRENPDGDVYRSAQQAADEIREKRLADHKQSRAKVVDVRTQWNRPPATQALVTLLLLAVCTIVAMRTGFGNESANEIKHQLMINTPYKVGSDGFPEVRSGEVWRLVTPIFLHFGVLHFAFNMYMLFFFGTQVESRRGSLRFSALVFLLAVTGNVAQYVLVNASFGGMSGVIYGLFGYSWMKSRFEPESGIFVDPGTIMMLMVWFFFCLFDIIPGVANMAHAAGLMTGMAIGYAPTFFRNLQR